METQSFFYKSIAVDVIIHTHSVHILFTEKLWEAMQPHYCTASMQIAKMIKEKFYQKNNQELLITTPSLAVEILGHILAYKMLLKFKKYASFLMNEKLYNAIKKRALQIDCGEKGYDNNRWFWNFLAFFFSLKSNGIS